MTKEKGSVKVEKRRQRPHIKGNKFIEGGPSNMEITSITPSTPDIRRVSSIPGNSANQMKNIKKTNPNGNSEQNDQSSEKIAQQLSEPFAKAAAASIDGKIDLMEALDILLSGMTTAITLDDLFEFCKDAKGPEFKKFVRELFTQLGIQTLDEIKKKFYSVGEIFTLLNSISNNSQIPQQSLLFPNDIMEPFPDLKKLNR